MWQDYWGRQDMMFMHFACRMKWHGESSEVVDICEEK